MCCSSKKTAWRRNSDFHHEATVRHVTIQPAWVRITHWINAGAVALMASSGWQIYAASPIFPVIHFAPSMTLGGWLGGALQWHFAVMWILTANFLVYLGLNIATGRLRRKLLPVSMQSLASDLIAALHGSAGPCRSQPLQRHTKIGLLDRHHGYCAPHRVGTGNMEIRAIAAAAHNVGLQRQGASVAVQPAADGAYVSRI